MLPLIDQGIVLRREQHLDNDVRLTLFLRKSGKVFVVVKGVRKSTSRLKALVEPFIEADFHLMLPEHRVYGRLISGTLINSHLSIRSHLPFFGYAAKCAEVINAMVPNRVPTSEVYDILQATFRSFDGSHDPENSWILFVTALLKILGHGDLEPELAGQSPSRSLAIVNNHLERHLPWQLKSEVFNFA